PAIRSRRRQPSVFLRPAHSRPPASSQCPGPSAPVDAAFPAPPPPGSASPQLPATPHTAHSAPDHPGREAAPSESAAPPPNTSSPASADGPAPQSPAKTADSPSIRADTPAQQYPDSRQPRQSPPPAACPQESRAKSSAHRLAPDSQHRDRSCGPPAPTPAAPAPWLSDSA